jgi:hypothetical protein
MSSRRKSDKSSKGLQVPEELVQIGFRGTVEYRANLARAALDRKIKVQEMLERAIDVYLADDSPRQPSDYKAASPKMNIEFPGLDAVESERYREVFVMPDNARLLALLMVILKTRNENAIRAVTSNLEVFSEYATIKGAPPPGKTHKARRAAK